MPSIQNGEATIYYETYGEGFPILTFAPGGLLSAIEVWHRPSAPLDPTKVFASEFQVIAMDQRNAPGRSFAPLMAQDGWHSFTSDHIALLDHLGIEKCHLYGQCIGGPFIFGLLQAQPQRIASAVIVQPIGRVGELLPGHSASFANWANTLKGHPETDEKVLDSFYANLYAPGFAYSVDRDFVRNCQTPCLVLAGNDAAHPFAFAEEVARLLPNAQFIPEWKEGQPLVEATARIKQFLTGHTPTRL